MKQCTVPGCKRIHHAKGYCNYHYWKIVIAPKYENTTCSVDGCDKPISPRFSKKKLCEKHGTRLLRNGSVEERRRERDIRSFAEEIAKSENPLDFAINNSNSFSEIVRCYYGDFCHECGWNKGPCEVHHIIPASVGGKSSINNAIVLCPNCHSLKHRKSGKKRLSDETRNQVASILKSISK